MWCFRIAEVITIDLICTSNTKVLVAVPLDFMLTLLSLVGFGLAAQIVGVFVEIAPFKVSFPFTIYVNEPLL